MNHASKIHERAWEELSISAGSDSYARYGLYASRTIAVKHPEVYLTADRWFMEGASQIKGFLDGYRAPTALAWCHMEYGRSFHRMPEDYTGIPNGDVLKWGDIDLSSYRVTDPDRIYPAPFFSFLDQRLAPLPVSLQVEGAVVSPLEFAEMYYLKVGDGKVSDNPLIVYCDNQEAYLWNDGVLISGRDGTVADSVTGSPVLIFGENAVWYPLFKRDDTDKSTALADAVDKLAGEKIEPSFENRSEEKAVRELITSSSLTNESQKTLASLASTRAGGWSFHPYYRPWQEFVPAEDFNLDISRHLGLVREFDKFANKVSPATAYLLGEIASSSGSLEDRLRKLSKEYLERTGMVREKQAHGWKKEWRLESWGHLWPCGLMEHTIDDAFRSRTAHCVSQSHIFGTMLDLMDIDHVVVNFNRGGIDESTNHHFVLSTDGTFLVDDGIINFRNGGPETEDYGPLLSFSRQGRWARTGKGELFGNIDSKVLSGELETIKKALDGRFPLRFFSAAEEDRIDSMDKFMIKLSDSRVEQVEID